MPPHSDAERNRSMSRRRLLAVGAGTVVTSLVTQRVAAEEQAPNDAGQMQPALRPHTASGYYTNDYKRLHANGPMDDTTRKIVRFVREFTLANIADQARNDINRVMLDSTAALIAGFEEDHIRLVAQLARMVQPGALKSTMLGYGIRTSPELGAWANSALMRATDFNDNQTPGGHTSDLIPAAFSVGEALHSSGLAVLTAIAIGYEIKSAPLAGNMEAVAAAMTAGKLMDLDEDRLANAVSMALVPHVPLNKGVGAYGMWKGLRSAEAVKNGVWAALMAREGITGPPQPFEGRGSLWSLNGAGRARALTLPVTPGELGIQRTWFKARPAEASSQGTLELVSDMRMWTKVDEIASIQYDMSFANWEEIADNPKFDPRNREMADHSMPYILARALIDGEIYLDSFTKEKFMDPVARALMAKMTFGPMDGWEGLGAARITIRRTDGLQRTWDTYGGVRRLTLAEYPRLTNDQLAAKFNRACAFRGVSDTQRDRARSIWGDLWSVRDIGEAIQTLATFGRPRAL